MAFTLPPSFVRCRALLQTAWFTSRTPTWVVGLASLAFALRKPWALHTPQLYAEDGSIFLQQQDQLGSAALLEPYMGYLHTIPRLVAWLAAHLLDPAWWPALYNGATFALTVALFFRIASSRFDVPGKPILLFAFAFSAHTGEVPLNVTNLQWIAAFFLLIHPLLSPPPSVAARVIDYALLVLVGLTGPFSVILLPVFLWNYWRDRRGSNLLPLVILAACAAVQVSFILRAGPASAAPGEPFRLLEFLSVIGSRLFIWSFFGAAAVAPLSNFLRAALAVIAFGTLVVACLRSHPRRHQHSLLLLGFALISAACFFRTRHDTWHHDNLENGDRYFYISRVLLFWFLAWGCASSRRGIAYLSAALVLLGFTVHLPSYRYPAPKDYHWAEHCDPIRRGVPAKIAILPEGWDMDYPGRPTPTPR